MSQIPRELEPRRAFWLEHARRSEHSGAPVHVYAAEHGLSAKALYRWRGRARREGVLQRPSGGGAKEGFVRVELAAPRASVLRVGLPNGCTVELSGALDSTLLAVVLRETAAL